MIVKFEDYTREKKVGVPMNKSLENVKMKSAEELLKENGISMEPPIDLNELTKKIGIQVKEHDFSVVEKKTGLGDNSILGATLLFDDNIMILYKKYAEKRNDHGKRFTIAHELGHCVLHAEEIENNHLQLRSEICNKNNPREVEANIFAGQLLIPEETLLRVLAKLLIPTLKNLAEIFDVSIGVMKHRLDDLRIAYFDDVKQHCSNEQK